MKQKVVFYSLIFCTTATLCLSLELGTVVFSPKAIFFIFTHKTSSIDQTILLQLRIPRTCSAFVTGALLAMSGCLMQILLRNPLADPYVLGVSGGAAVAMLLGMSWGLSGLWQHFAAYAGSLLALMLVYCFARKPKHWSPFRLLLIGIVLASGWGAIISLILSLSPNQTLHSMLFWLMGDLNQNTIPYFGFMVLILSAGICLYLATSLNILTLSTNEAKLLGLHTERLYFLLFLLSGVMTATAVNMGGTIGFIGLITPHILRLLIGSDHRLIIPGSILLGGSLLTMADTLARYLVSPQQLPVGIFTAFLGIPLFLYLLNRS